MMHVIIATRDRAPVLASTLEALAMQAWPGCPFDICRSSIAARPTKPRWRS
jgi:hypothetical protein